MIKMNDALYHYGTPRHSGRYPYGSGKRPYQGEKHDVTYSTDSTSKHRQHNKDVNDIYKTFSDREKSYANGEDDISPPPEQYYEPNVRYNVAARVYADVLKIKDVPVGYIEYWNEGDGGLNVSIGVRNEEQYRNIGVASRLSKRGEKEIKRMKKEGILSQNINTLRWYANSDNVKSINAAIKNGFDDKGEHVHKWNDVKFRKLEKTI